MESEEVLIINDAGNVLFYYTPGKETDCGSKNLLMASFLTAIQQFAKVMEHGALFSFDLAKKKIVMRNAAKLPIFYVFLVDPDSKIARKTKKLEEVLDNIQEEFEKRYDEKVVRSWKGDVNTFFDFRKCIEQSGQIK